MQIKTVPVALTDRIQQLRQIRLVEVHIQYIDAVEQDSRLQRVGISHFHIRQRRRVFLLITRKPYMHPSRVDRLAYRDRITEDMRLMHTETQTVNTVASVYTRHHKHVLTTRT